MSRAIFSYTVELFIGHIVQSPKDTDTDTGYDHQIQPKLEKTTAIRRIAVRETSVFRPNGGSIEGPP